MRRRDSYDFVIVGGGSAGSALANRLSSDSGTTVLVLEAGRSDFRIDPFIHMPAALPFPIGNPLYDWKYETEPEPHLNDRRVYHARGKVLGGSSSINGMIFQRGNPMDFERWAADPGMETWDFQHCLPYFKRMETLVLADGRRGADDWRGGSGPLVLERGRGPEPAVRRLLRGGTAGGLPAHRRRQRLPPGGLRALRPQHLARPAAVGRPGLPAPGDGPAEPPGGDAGARHRGPVRRHACGRGRLPARRTRPPYRPAGEVILCGGAINTPQLLQLSGVGDPAHLEPLGVPMVHALPGRRREPPGPSRGLHPVRLDPAGVDRAGAEVAQAADDRLRLALPPPRVWEPRTTSRAAASAAATTTSPGRT